MLLRWIRGDAGGGDGGRGGVDEAVEGFVERAALAAEVVVFGPGMKEKRLDSLSREARALGSRKTLRSSCSA